MEGIREEEKGEGVFDDFVFLRNFGGAVRIGSRFQCL